MKNNIVVWFSCGAASAIASKLTLEKYKDSHNVLIVNTPIKEEHQDNQRFLEDVSKWLNHPIIKIKNKNYPNSSITEIFEKRKYMTGINGAPCTMILKKEARYQFELEHDIDYHVFGFTYDEIERHERFIKYERSNVLPVLIENKITKHMCFDILANAKIKRPEIYNLGFPNANCIGCVKSQSQSYWNLVKKHFPIIFRERAEQSRRIGTKLLKVNGKRLYLDEIQTNRIKSRIKSWECGLFCDTE